MFRGRLRHRTYLGIPLLSASIVPALLPFAPLFTAPTWHHVQILVTGTLLAQGPRTVATALRVMGLAHEPWFERDHRVLSRGRWSGVQGSQILLGLLMALLPLDWPILVVVNETLERRKGARVARALPSRGYTAMRYARAKVAW